MELAILKKDKIAASIILTPPDTKMTKPWTLQVDGDLGTDVITIVGIGINGTDETDAYDADELALELSQTKMWHTFFGPVRIKVSKPNTTNAVGVMRIPS